MSLRLKLVFALVAAAILPMAVVVGVPVLQAESAAREEANARLARASSGAELLLERHCRDAAARVERAAVDLVGDPAARIALLRGPEERAREIAGMLAAREGLDHLEIAGARGLVLSSSLPDAPAGGSSAFGDLPADGVVQRILSLPDMVAVPACIARRSVAVGEETFDLVGTRAIDARLVDDVSEIIGEPAALVDGADRVVVAAHESRGAAAERISARIPMGETGLYLRVSTPAPDVRRARRESWLAFAGVAPLAVTCAFLVGVVLAHGIARPIRALAGRAEKIAATSARRPSVPIERNEVRRLTRTFDEMLSALSASEGRRLAAERIAVWQDVAKRIAHEVKNPLSPIKLAVENLRRTHEKAPQDLGRALEAEGPVILEEVESLRRLVDEFSLFARLPAPQLERFDVQHVVAQTLALYAPRIEADGVRLERPDVAEPLLASIDPEQIGRVLKNLIANALDALEPVTDRRLSIALRRMLLAGGDWIELRVADSGVGFDAETRENLFRPYFTTRAERGGTGLGMAIAYRIVTEHGGTIEADGAAGCGATITVRLPVEPAQPAA